MIALLFCFGEKNYFDDKDSDLCKDRVAVALNYLMQ